MLEAPLQTHMPESLSDTAAWPGDERLTSMITGGRSPIDDRLTQIGARATATWRAECGIAYYSRHYRVRPGAACPPR